MPYKDPDHKIRGNGNSDTVRRELPVDASYDESTLLVTRQSPKLPVSWAMEPVYLGFLS